MMNIIEFVTTHIQEIIAIYLSLVGLASLIVKMTPTLKDDAILKKVIKFVGKFIALNRK